MECTPSRESLLALIRPDMETIPKEFFKRIYAFELDYHAFSEQAIAALEAAGCSKARQYYQDWVSEYEVARDAELDSILKGRWKGDGERRKMILGQKKKLLLMQKLQR